MTRRATLADPPCFHLAERHASGVRLESDTGAVAHLLAPHPGLMRLVLLPDGAMRQPRTWAIAPGLPDIPDEGRDRFDLADLSPPGFTLEQAEGALTLATDHLRVTVALDGFRCRWEVRDRDAWREVVRDRPTQAYDFGWWDGRVHHHLARRRDDKVFGLGERTGPMDRTGRRFRLSNIDPMGYDAERTDPLYKHIPFFMVREPRGACAGLFYDTAADCSFDFGQELDNYHGLYRSFTAEHGDLDLWVVAGPSPLEVVRRFTWLTGEPAAVPRWSLGYSGSTMTYTDAPDAQSRMGEFVAKLREHDLPCSSFHLSSGYTSIGAKRYVFHWNRDKFPDPSAFAASYAEAGIRLIANIKPALLRDHPRFAEAAAAGLLIAEADGAPSWVQFWDEVGAHLDFTNPATLAWWKGQVKTALLDHGIAATWNDNNEFELWSDRALANGFGAAHPARQTRAVQPLLMMRASRQAQAEHAPETTPFLVTRSGSTGMHRYAQTWSGDNFTRWETLRGNLHMGLGLALSGVSNTGHDVGGFSGPAPDAELFVRWVQANLLTPRFSIHSWNDDATVNEPWMHPAATPAIHALLQLRARFTPYLFDRLHAYSEHCEPVMRPTFLDFPEDLAAWAANDEWMLGDALLVAPVLDPGVSTRRVRPPLGADWIDLWTGARIAGGETVEVRAELDARPPMFLRAGRILALDLATAGVRPQPPERALLLALSGGEETVRCTTRLDDGERAGAPALSLSVALIAHIDALDVALSRAPETAGAPLSLLFAAPDDRPIRVEGATLLDEGMFEGRRRVELRLR